MASRADIDGRRDRQRGSGTSRQCSDGPDSSAGEIRSRAGAGRDERDSGWQLVGNDHSGRRVRASVIHAHRVVDRATREGSGVIDRQNNRQVHGGLNDHSVGQLGRVVQHVGRRGL